MPTSMPLAATVAAGELARLDRMIAEKAATIRTYADAMIDNPGNADVYACRITEANTLVTRWAKNRTALQRVTDDAIASAELDARAAAARDASRYLTICTHCGGVGDLLDDNDEWQTCPACTGDGH